MAEVDIYSGRILILADKFISMKIRYLALAVLFGVLSCAPQQDNAGLQREIVENLTMNVVIPTYDSLHKAAKTLHATVQTLAPGQEKAFAAAKIEWMAARDYWERSEGFLFGPVDYEEIDPALDTWPVDVTAIQEILENESAIDSDLVRASPEARGFHLIEFLLWGADGKKTAAQLNEKEISYLKAAIEDFVQNTEKLSASWSSGENPFKETLIEPGAQNGHYSSHREVLDEFKEGIIGIADEMANQKIDGPLGNENESPELHLQESYFSDNTRQDLINNLISISAVYLGDAKGQEGSGLTDLVLLKDSDLDREIKEALHQSMMALEHLPVSFSKALLENRGEVLRAQQQIQNLFGHLEKIDLH